MYSGAPRRINDGKYMEMDPKVYIHELGRAQILVARATMVVRAGDHGACLLVIGIYIWSIMILGLHCDPVISKEFCVTTPFTKISYNNNP